MNFIFMYLIIVIKNYIFIIENENELLSCQKNGISTVINKLYNFVTTILVFYKRK